jgi:MoaA/NifB/PqqE/SkfB family radical SAM enzyme
MISIRNLEMHVAHVCNLTCEGCSHFSANGHRGVVRLAECVRWMAGWNQRIQPQSFRILGGEPTINPELCEIIAAVGEAWPQSRRYFTTNAFFVHRHPTLGEALGKAQFTGVKISIHSNEPEYTSKVAANIQTMLDWGKRYGFEVNVNDAYRSWSRVYFGTGKNVKPYQLGNPRKSWEACFTKNYPQLLNGLIYKCPLTAYIKLQHATHGTAPEWKPALEYEGLTPDCTDAEMEEFFRREEEPVCGLCPHSYHHFKKPLPLRTPAKVSAM